MGDACVNGEKCVKKPKLVNKVSSFIKPDVMLLTKNVMVPHIVPSPNKFFPVSPKLEKKVEIVKAPKFRSRPDVNLRKNLSAVKNRNQDLKIEVKQAKRRKSCDDSSEPKDNKSLRAKEFSESSQLPCIAVAEKQPFSQKVNENTEIKKNRSRVKMETRTRKRKRDYDLSSDTSSTDEDRVGINPIPAFHQTFNPNPKYDFNSMPIYPANNGITGQCNFNYLRNMLNTTKMNLGLLKSPRNFSLVSQAAEDKTIWMKSSDSSQDQKRLKRSNNSRHSIEKEWEIQVFNYESTSSVMGSSKGSNASDRVQISSIPWNGSSEAEIQKNLEILQDQVDTKNGEVKMEDSLYGEKEKVWVPKNPAMEEKYSWQDEKHWIPPIQRNIQQVSDSQDPKLSCKIKYSWEIYGISVQTSRELIQSLLDEEFERKHPCSVKYSWQINGIATQVSLDEDTRDYWVGVIRSANTNTFKGIDPGKSTRRRRKYVSLQNECTQTSTEIENQTDYNDFQVTYSWENILKQSKQPKACTKFGITADNNSSQPIDKSFSTVKAISEEHKEKSQGMRRDTGGDMKKSINLKYSWQELIEKYLNN